MFNTNSQFKNSTLDTPDEFLDSEPNPTNFSKTPFQHITPTTPVENSTSASHTLTLPLSFPLFPDEQLEHDLDNFINHQQQIHSTNNSLTIRQLTHSASTYQSSIPPDHFAPTRAKRTFMKRKHAYKKSTISHSPPIIISTRIPSPTPY